MYRNEQELHFARRQSVDAHAMTASHQDHQVLLMVLASAIVVLWIACLSTLTAPFLPKLYVVAQHHASTETINRLHKGDRLPPMNFHDRWNAIAVINKDSDGGQSFQRILDGCEPAFSHLVKVGNFSARCIARVDAPWPLSRT